MAEQIFNTRIGLKIDSLENWSKTENQFTLKAGEVAFATVAATAGNGLTEPVIMAKIGDGTNTFNGLGWDFYAKASDVYAWAKETGLSVTAATGAEGNVLTGISWDATANGGKGGLVYTKASVALSTELTALNDIVTALSGKVDGMYTNEQIDAAIKVVSDALATHEQAFTDFKTSNTEAIADAKKAGTDAAAAVEALKTTEVQAAQDRADAAYALAESKDANVIESIKVNGTALEIVDKVVDIDVPTEDEIKTIAADEIGRLIDASGDAETLKSIGDLVDYAEKNAGDIAQLVTDVGTANTNASAAVETANSANTTAGEALAKANQAIDANTGAVAAKEAAEAAQAKAEEAQGKAEAAQQAAEDAKAAAEASNTSATAIANEAKGIAEGASTVAGEAKTAADAATEAVAGLHAIAKSGNVADLEQTEGTYIIFDCGSATKNV